MRFAALAKKGVLVALLALLFLCQAFPVSALQRVGRVDHVGQWTYRAYDADASAIFAAMSTQPSGARKALINSTVLSLKAAGVWDRMSMLQAYAAHDQQAARVDWKIPSRTATAVNSPAFVADRGFTGDGATSYLDTGYNPSTDANFALGNNSFGFRINANLASAAEIELGNTNHSIMPRSAATTFFSIRSGNGTATDLAAISSSARFIAVARSGTGAFVSYYVTSAGVFTNGPGFSQVSSAISNLNLFAGARNNAGTPASYSTRQVSLVFSGANLDATQMEAFATTMNAYMTAIGNTN